MFDDSHCYIWNLSNHQIYLTGVDESKRLEASKTAATVAAVLKPVFVASDYFVQTSAVRH